MENEKTSLNEELEAVIRKQLKDLKNMNLKEEKFQDASRGVSTLIKEYEDMETGIFDREFQVAKAQAESDRFKAEAERSEAETERQEKKDRENRKMEILRIAVDIGLGILTLGAWGHFYHQGLKFEEHGCYTSKTSSKLPKLDFKFPTFRKR